MDDVNGFKGYYMHDKLPKLHKNQCIIINLDDSAGSGTHWTAAMRGDDFTYYYDSFGLPPSDDIVKKLDIIAYSDNQHQQIISSSCGLFCLYVLYLFMNDGIDFEDIVASGNYLIPFDSMANEVILREFLES